MPEPAKLQSPIEIARHFGVPTHRVRYAIRSHGIEPVLVAGPQNWKFFDAAGVEQIRRALREAEARWQPHERLAMVWRE